MKRIFTIVVLIASLVFTSCEDFLTEDVRGQLNVDTYYKPAAPVPSMWVPASSCAPCGASSARRWPPWCPQRNRPICCWTAAPTWSAAPKCWRHSPSWEAAILEGRGPHFAQRRAGEQRRGGVEGHPGAEGGPPAAQDHPRHPLCGDRLNCAMCPTVWWRSATASRAT